MTETLCRLRLLQLADSALPIGSLAHSFGLETLVEEQAISVSQLFPYIEGLLEESLLLDAVYCRAAHACGAEGKRVPESLNRRLSALRPARESRQASLSLGRRFVRLALALAGSAELREAAPLEEIHFPVAFGYVCGLLSIDVADAVTAFLHQNVWNVISAAQRLMSLGQIDASRIAWDLKPSILEAERRAAALSVENVSCFSHLPELASMRHPRLATRLFIS